MSHLSDQELMRIVQAGDFSPAAEIYDRYSVRIFAFATRFLRNTEAAEDATQEVFIKMLKNAHQFKADAKLSTWLFAITANLCRDHMRRLENRIPKEPLDILYDLPGSSELGPERHLERRESERIILKALELLPPELLESLWLARYQGMTYSEIAKVVGASEGAVKTRVFRAMEILRATLVGPADEGEQPCLNVVQ
jgi:RNA polymerase sigma-70 factor (ECF subfamily)